MLRVGSPQIQRLNCLEDGCGSGYGTHYLSSNGVKEIMGIDISSEAIEYATKHFTETNY
jgi:2-polyprenyl-3-methyl-5-hydroxy-6-metoxy-1,4-benzoquinol methylase